MAVVSIIVPVYNVEPYLKKCLDSIINQTFTDIEIILVDDGSTDNSSIICDDYSKEDPRVKVIHKKNAGLSSARNAGLEVATGQFISFIDSDDYIDPSFIEELLFTLKSNDADISICNFEIVDYLNNNKINTPDISELTTNEEGFWECSANTRYALTIVAWNKLYKKSLFSGIKYREGMVHEDQEIIHKIIMNCNKISFINKRLYYYSKRSGSITTKKTEKMYMDEIFSFVNRSNYFLTKPELYSFYLKNTNRIIFNYCEMSYRYAPNKKMKKIIYRLVSKGKYGGSLKRQLLWIVQIFFPRIMYLVVYKKN